MQEGGITISRRGLLLGLALIAVLSALGVGGYLIGHSSGEDLDAARSEGAAQGQRDGAAQGAEEGFSEGRKEGRKAAFAKSYEKSYREGYQSSYEDAGLDPPDEIDVPKREP